MKPVMAMAVAAPLLLASGPGTTTDLHHFWDQTCGDCHRHAGDFARKALTVKDGKLQGSHHKDNLLVFLEHHYLPQDLVQPMYDMLLAQAETAPEFKQRCGRCHETAAELARESLEQRDGVLMGRESGRPVADFLPRHAKLRLTAEETDFFVRLLTRVEREVHSGG